ncbi:MAG TPA: spermidine/putrescine ABC transporter substrate-binding protein [Gaiellaceae bacterium]|jgi:spermidine/putrescine transport system substrate-binding protein|nr:spermidine/putrescine ABC transporter substrate-binding protein [Gaiellaceae bacterium]
MTDPITRRELLRRAALGGAALGVPSLLAACGGDGIEGEAGQETEPTTSVRRELAKTLVFANWPFYIDISEDGNRRPTLEQFTRETGVRVRYIEEVNDNEEWFGKYQAQLARGDDIGRDIVVLTDWMAARMLRLDYLQPLDRETIPNADNLVANLRSPGWDPDREYSLPWQSGLTGIAWNRKRTGGPVTTVEQLLTDPKLKGRVTMLTEMPDTVGVTMAANGDDPENVTPEGFSRAVDTIRGAVDSGQIRRFTGNDYTDDLIAENVWAALAWSGDIVSTVKPEKPEIEFSVIETKSHIWTDNMLIPLGGDVFTASTFMNFVYDPKIAAQIEAYVNYICPVEGAQEEIRNTDPSLAENELIFPTEETRANTFIFDAEAADNPDFKEQFQAVIGA